MKNLKEYGIDKSKGRDYENITYILALIYNILNKQVEEYLSQYDINLAQFNALMLVAYQNNGKGINQVEISNRFIVSVSGITKVIDKLVKQELVTRTQNPNSRRENIIKITNKGQKLIDKVWPQYNELVKTLTDKIPSNKQKTAKDILNVWFNNLQKGEK